MKIQFAHLCNNALLVKSEAVNNTRTGWDFFFFFCFPPFVGLFFQMVER